VKITKEHLEAQVAMLNRVSGGDYEIGYAYGQARVEAAHGSRDISPRGTKREVSMYLRCMITAVQRYQDAEWKLVELNRSA
jgi:hypothetical protein